MFETALQFCNDFHFLSDDASDPPDSMITISSDVMLHICTEVEVNELSSIYNEPMVLIGIYISIASLVCIYAMYHDLSYAFRARKYWFPTKYFSLNTMSIMVIAVAMKLPADLSSPMPVAMDQIAKIGGLAFMCTMMSNFMPSLASMDNKSLLANVIGLSIFVITLIVNTFIQIKTHLIHSNIYNDFSPPFTLVKAPSIEIVAYIYTGILFFLLLILISSAITIPTSKKILEIKYNRATRTATLNDPQANLNPAIENLKQLVKKYWIMADTGSPQFVVASSPLSFASGIICLFSMLMYIYVVWWLFPWHNNHSQNIYRDYILSRTSAYKWSINLMVIIQTIGIILGSVAPIGRCFILLSLKPFADQIKKQLMVHKVDDYWTQNLYEWKESCISFLSSTRRSRLLLHKLKNVVLIFCIGYQKVIVILCKIIGFIVIILTIIVTYCPYFLIKSVNTMIFTKPTDSSSGHTNTANASRSNGHTNTPTTSSSTGPANTPPASSSYVLLLEDDVQLDEKTMKRISDSMDRLIQKVEKKQHKNLLRLLEQSFEFFGVQTFDTDQFRFPLYPDHVNSWSLPIISLTCIAIIIPNIPIDGVDKLLQSVGEGLLYTHLVEKSLNREPKYVNIRRATLTLWHEVEDKYKWLENTLETSAYEGNTPETIIKLFAQKAENFMNEINGVPVENLPLKLIAANSMYRIAHTIIHTYRSHGVKIIGDELFEELSVMIADILAACLTNIPRVIKMRCQESAIEKLESSVVAAVDLLGRTTEIINTLRTHVLPNMDPDEIGYIDKWRRHLFQP